MVVGAFLKVVSDSDLWMSHDALTDVSGNSPNIVRIGGVCGFGVSV